MNVMGPPVMMVTTAVAKRVASALDIATTVSIAVVGTVAGARYFPFASMMPQPGLQDGLAGKEMVFVASCVTSQETP